MPVLFTRSEPHHITRPNLLDRAAEPLHTAGARDDDQSLSKRMRVPVRANIAFAIAGATGGTPGSPPPPGAAVLSTRSRLMRRGVSLIGTIPPRREGCPAG